MMQRRSVKASRNAGIAATASARALIILDPSVLQILGPVREQAAAQRVGRARLGLGVEADRRNLVRRRDVEPRRIVRERVAGGRRCERSRRRDACSGNGRTSAALSLAEGQGVLTRRLRRVESALSGGHRQWAVMSRPSTDLIVLDTLGKLYAHRQRPPPLHSISRVLAPRLVALAGVLALVWLVGRLWAPGAPPPSAIPAAPPVAAPAIVEPVAPAMSPAPVAEMPAPAPEAAPMSDPAPLPAAEAPPASPPVLEFAPPPPAMPAIAAPRDLRPEEMSDAQLLNLLELRRIAQMPRRQR
jgi:hypothetical protein